MLLLLLRKKWSSSYAGNSICLPDEEPQALFNVPLSELQQFTGMLRTHAADLPSPVTPVVHEMYVGLVDKGFMQLSNTLDKQCMRVMGFMRVQPRTATLRRPWRTLCLPSCMC